MKTASPVASDDTSRHAYALRWAVLDLALTLIGLGAMPRPEGHPETWPHEQGFTTEVVARAKQSASPHVRSLLRDRERHAAALVSVMRPAQKHALKRTRRERAHAAGLCQDDSMQDGLLGLLRAVDLWDPYRGLQFNTFGTHWIVMQTRRGAQRNSHLRCPAAYSEHEEKRKEGREALRKPRYSFERLLGADEAELANSSGVVQALRGAIACLPTAERQIDEDRFRRRLSASLAKLKPRLQEIAISHVYRDESHQEIADRLGVSRQAVGQAWAKIEALLRAELGASA